MHYITKGVFTPVKQLAIHIWWVTLYWRKRINCSVPNCSVPEYGCLVIASSLVGHFKRDICDLKYGIGCIPVLLITDFILQLLHNSLMPATVLLSIPEGLKNEWRKTMGREAICCTKPSGGRRNCSRVSITWPYLTIPNKRNLTRGLSFKSFWRRGRIMNFLRSRTKIILSTYHKNHL